MGVGVGERQLHPQLHRTRLAPPFFGDDRVDRQFSMLIVAIFRQFEINRFAG
jgi:hypothetical protein